MFCMLLIRFMQKYVQSINALRSANADDDGNGGDDCNGNGASAACFVSDSSVNITSIRNSFDEHKMLLITH